MKPMALDVTDLIHLYTGAFAGLAAGLHMEAMIDGRALAESLARSPVGKKGADYALELLCNHIVAEIDAREAKAAGPRLVAAAETVQRGGDDMRDDRAR